MHSFGYRANALLTFAVTILALMCAIASFSDNLNNPSPTAEVKVLSINWFQRQPNGNDEVSMTLNISSNLQSMFTWNTKQDALNGFFPVGSGSSYCRKVEIDHSRHSSSVSVMFNNRFIA